MNISNPTDALLQLASHLKNFALPTAAQLNSKSKRVPLALLPETIGAGRIENSFYAAPRAAEQTISAPSAPKILPSRRKLTHIFENPLDGLRNTEFRMEAPSAKSVQLAADFTEWEKSPLDLVQSYDGSWFTIVPLLPGTYSYRFIVDGQWLDDPQSARHVPNPFGSEDAVLDVD